MANVRVTIGRRSRQPGDRVGVQVNTFGLDKLSEITAQELADVALMAMQPAFDQAHGEWPVLTGASRDSMSLDVVEAEGHKARVALQVGGEQLVSDPRNVSHKDYAPFIEFNGTATARPGIIRDAVYDNDSEIRSAIHDGVRQLIEEKLR